MPLDKNAIWKTHLQAIADGLPAPYFLNLPQIEAAADWIVPGDPFDSEAKQVFSVWFDAAAGRVAHLPDEGLSLFADLRILLPIASSAAATERDMAIAGGSVNIKELAPPLFDEALAERVVEILERNPTGLC